MASTTLKAIAAATVMVVPLLPSPDFAAGVVFLLASPPFAVAVSLPKAACLSPFLLAVPPLSPDLSLAPLALAVASVSVSEEPSASNETAFWAVVLRFWEASTVYLATVTAMDAPMARLPPVVAPVAVVLLLAVSVARLSSLPARVRSAPVPTLAVVVTLSTLRATTAVSVRLPPSSAPLVAEVLLSEAPVARRTRSFSPVGLALSASPARVVSVTRLIATPAPAPTVEPPPVVCDVAVVWFCTLDVAVSAAFPLITGAVGRTSASVFRTTRLKATEPATAAAPPLPFAPDSLVAW